MRVGRLTRTEFEPREPREIQAVYTGDESKRARCVEKEETKKRHPSRNKSRFVYHCVVYSVACACVRLFVLMAD